MPARSDYHRLYALLGRPTRAKRMRGDGDRATYGVEGEVGVADFVDHCNDAGCLALSPLNGRGDAIFLAIDIDARFYHRLEVIAEVLRSRGLASGAFALSGSAPWRGKVIVALAAPISQEHARELVDEIVREAKTERRFGHLVDASEVTMFPQDGQGGHVRVLGRNRNRVSYGRVEALLDLDGAPIYCVDAIEPVKIESKTRTIRRGSPREPDNIRSLVLGPYNTRGAAAYADVLRLARAAVNHRDDTEAALAKWCAELVRNSPNMSAGARAQFTRPDVQRRALLMVRSTPRAAPGAWKPVSPHHNKTMVSYGALNRGFDVYAALAAYITENRLDAHAFGATYARIRDLGGFHSKRSAQRAIHDARDAGLVAILDAGEPRKGGLCSLFTLRGVDETLADAIQAGIESDPFQKRIADRKARGLGPPAIFVKHPARPSEVVPPPLAA